MLSIMLHYAIELAKTLGPDKDIVINMSGHGDKDMPQIARITLGVEVEPTADGIRIQGGPMGGGVVESHGDHRIAMAFSIASLRANETISIVNCSNVNTSFPGFVDLARQAGVRVTSHG